MSNFRKILFPFSILYDAITSVRNVFFESHILKSTKFDIPVIVVGNLSVGGTGKTPQIEYLIRLLENRFKVAVLSRGYKRKTAGFLLANEHTSVLDIGDEPFQYYNKFDTIYVAVDEDRVHGINELERLNKPPNVILLDDAYQHRKVVATANILLTPYHDLYVSDLLLPAGNLRESKRGVKRADLVVVTKCPNDLSVLEQEGIALKLKLDDRQQLFFSTIKYAEIVKGNTMNLSLSSLKGHDLILITGIANPSPLVSFLKSLNLKVQHFKYPDHHGFSDSDVSEIMTNFDAIASKNKLILTTEKDYVRLKSRLDIYFIEIEMVFLSRKDVFDNIVNCYVE